MRASTLFTVTSLFLIGSYGLPQPEKLEATRAIEERQARIPEGIIPSDGEKWHQQFDKDGGCTPSSNSTKIKEREAHCWKDLEKYKHFKDEGSHPSSNGTMIKEREAHHEWPSDMPDENFRDFFDHEHGVPGTPPGTPPSSNSTTTKIKQRQAPEHFGQLPDGMSWEEFKKHFKHMNHEDATNTTNVRARKLRE